MVEQILGLFSVFKLGIVVTAGRASHLRPRICSGEAAIAVEAKDKQIVRSRKASRRGGQDNDKVTLLSLRAINSITTAANSNGPDTDDSASYNAYIAVIRKVVKRRCDGTECGHINVADAEGTTRLGRSL